MTTPATDQQQAPTPNSGQDVWLLVIAEMEERRQFGLKKYGQPVRAFNGRDPLVDAYQEALDLCVYLRQAIAERDAVPDYEKIRQDILEAERTISRTPKRRTRSEVIAAKKTIGGCCSRHADNQACDCLSEAIDDRNLDKDHSGE